VNIFNFIIKTKFILNDSFMRGKKIFQLWGVRNYWGILISSLAFLICMSSAYSAPLVIEKTGRVTPDPFTRILEDPSAELTFNDILKPENQKKFRPTQKKILNFGYSPSAFWVRMTIKNMIPDGSDRFNLQANFPNIHYIDYFAPGPDGTWQQTATGMMRPAKSRQVKTTRFAFNLEIPHKTQKTVYLRFKSEASLSLQTELWDQNSYLNALSAAQIRSGILLGILIIMLGYNLFLYFALKEISYFHYSLSLAGILMMALSMTGIGFYYCWPEAPGFNRFIVPISNASMIMVCLMFAISFLQIKCRAPRLYRFLEIQMILAGVFLILVFLLPYRNIIQPIVLLNILSFVSIAVSSIYIWFKGFKPARFFLLPCGRPSL